MSNTGGVLAVAGLGLATFVLFKMMNTTTSDETAGANIPSMLGSADSASQVAGLPGLITFPDNGAGNPEIEPPARPSISDLLSKYLNMSGAGEAIGDTLRAASGLGGGGCCVAAPSNTYVTNYSIPPMPPVVIPPAPPYPTVTNITQVLQQAPQKMMAFLGRGAASNEIDRAAAFGGGFG